MIIVPNLRFPGFSGAWVERKLGEVLTIGSGKDYKHLNSGNIPVYGTGGCITSVDQYLYNGTSIGIGRKGTIDKPILLKGKFWTVDTLFYTHSFINSYPKFLFSIFQKINWKKYNEASGVPSLSKTTIERIKISIPPLPEQQKITLFISLINKRISTQIEIIEHQKSLKRGLMQQLFSQQLRFKDNNGVDSPGWEEKRLGDYCSFFSGGTPISTTRKYYNGNIPFIGSGNISQDFVASYISEEALKNSSAKLVEKGDVLYALYGATSGEVAISKINGAINQAVLCIRTEEIDSYLLFQVLKMNKEKITSKYLQGGQGNLSAKIIRNLKLLIPSSKKEQTKIAIFLSSIDKKLEREKHILEAYKQQKKYLLQNMFV